MYVNIQKLPLQLPVKKLLLRVFFPFLPCSELVLRRFHSPRHSMQPPALQPHEAYQAAMAYASSSAGRAERREEMPEGPGKEERADKPENAQNGEQRPQKKNTPESNGEFC